MRLQLIVNPVAGHGRARRVAVGLVDALRSTEAEVSVSETSMPGEGTRLAAESRADVVVAVGGDGTVHEVASGLVSSGNHAAMAVVAGGSGNDFARALGMPVDVGQAARVLTGGRQIQADYGRVRWRAEGSSGESVFVNAVGCGFDAFVADRARHVRYLRGLSRYLAAVIWSLPRWTNPRAVVKADAFEWEGRLLLCTVGNGHSSGGGFLLTPDASIYDGVLDVCLARSMGLARKLRIIPMALRGSHVHQPEIRMVRTRAAHIVLEAGVPVHVDGEIVAPDVRELWIEVVPAALRVLIPN